MPKEFHVQINTTFFADDMFDALAKLGHHLLEESEWKENPEKDWSNPDMLVNIMVHPTSDCDEAHTANAQENDEL